MFRTMDRHQFNEEQQFRCWWMWLILLIALVPLPLIYLVRTLTGNQVTNNPVAHMVFVLIVFMVAAVAFLFFLFLKLTVKINGQGIWYGFNIPDHSLNLLKWEEVERCEVISYRCIGYGYRKHAVYGTVYNVKGRQGLLIVTCTGERLLLGTQLPTELLYAVQAARM